MDAPLLTRIAQTLGITLSSVWGGTTLGLSIFLIPALSHAPAPTALKQWASTYNVGKLVGPPLSLLAAGAYGYLAYKVPSSVSSHAFAGYVTAAVLSAMVGPYTVILMSATNGKLMAKEVEARGLKSGEVGVEKGETTQELLRTWGGV